jgi:ribonuclease Z
VGDCHRAPPLALTFLGTRDAAPSLRARTSAILVVHGSGRLLVDAGVGTTRGLRRAGLRASDLDAALVTHWHWDHVAGLPPLVRARERPLPVRGPPPPRALTLAVRSRLDFTPVTDGDELSLAGLTCTAFVTAHGGIASVGWLLADGEGRRVAITGDTRPDAGVAAAVAGVDVLVSEATFAGDHGQRAHRTGHSTARETGRLAAAAGAGALVLVHLSMRYPREAVRDEAAREHPLVIVPDDGDRLAVHPAAARSPDGGWARVELARAAGR